MKCNRGEGGTLKREKIGVRLADVSRRWKKGGRGKGRRKRREGGREEVWCRMLSGENDGKTETES